MESEFLYKVSDQDDRYYEYDDLHPSNQLRFYKHDGLDSNPLSLTTLVSHALKSKDIRGMSRLQGQEIMEKDSMFQDFMEAVKAKGFFNITEKEIMSKQTNGGSIVTSREKKEKRSRRSSSTRRMTMTNKPSRQDVQEAETLKVKGNAAMQQKKYALAKNFYTEALKAAPSGPTSHVYYSNRSAALLSMRNFTEAVWDAERSIKLKPEYPKAHARLGLANFLLGMYQEAVDSYVKAVELEPKNKTSISYLERSRRKLITANKPPDADDDEMSVSSRTSCTSRRSRRSRSKQRKSMMKSRRSTITVPKAVLQSEYEGFSAPTMDEDDACASDFDPTLVETPNDKLEEANRLKVNGNKAMARTQYSEAIKLYSNALRLAPAGPQSHVYFSNRAAALCYLARYEEAELDAERALALHPEFGKAHARLGLSRYFLKDYHGAVEAYESASAYDPDNESNRIYLAKAKFKLGRRQSVAGRE
eukprot:scaffold118_cov251-Chaetoceros_neogracile.AAC.2